MVIKYHVQKPIGFATLMLYFLLLACVSATLAAEEDHAVKAAPWMIAGAVAAFDDDDVQVKAMALEKLVNLGASATLKNRIAEIAPLLQHQQWLVQLSAIHAFRAVGDAARTYAADIIRGLMDGKVNIYSGNIAWVASMLTDADSNAHTIVVAWLKGKDVDDALWVLSEMGKAAAVYEPEIAAMLKHKNTYISGKAIGVLQSMGKTQAHAPAIADLLQDEDSYVRDKAVKALAGLGEKDGQPYVAEISALLKHSDAKVRAGVASALRDAGNAAGAYAGAIAALLLDQDLSVRSYAIQALGKMGEAGGRFAVEIAEHLKDDDREVRNSAISALGDLNDAAKKRVAPTVAMMLKDNNPDIRLFALGALNSMDATAYAPEVAALLTDEYKGIRQEAVNTLADMGAAGGKVAEAIALLLRDEDVDVRRRAVFSLGKMGEEAQRRVVPKIVRLLKDNNPEIRKSALDAMAHMGSVAIAYASDIAALLKDKEPDIRRAAVAVLSKTGEAAGNFATDIAALTGRGGHSWRKVFAGMNEAARKKAAPIIAGFLQDSHPDIRRTAINTLVQIGKPGRAYASAVARLLKDEDAGVRDAAMSGLSQMGEPGHAYASAVGRLLIDNDDLQAAVSVLGNMGEAAGRYAPDIAALLDMDKAGYNLTADLLALGNMGDAGRAQAPRIAKLLLMKNNNYYRGHGSPGSPPPDGVHEDVVNTLAGMGSFETHEAVFTVLRAKGGHPDGFVKRRFLIHYLSGGKL